VLVATKPVDFRKGGDGLAALVREALGEDPLSGIADERGTAFNFFLAPVSGMISAHPEAIFSTLGNVPRLRDNGFTGHPPLQ
jgi:hypothetical protein